MLQSNPNLKDLVSDAAAGLNQRFQAEAIITAAAPGRASRASNGLDDWCKVWMEGIQRGLKSPQHCEGFPRQRAGFTVSFGKGNDGFAGFSKR